MNKQQLSKRYGKIIDATNEVRALLDSLRSDVESYIEDRSEPWLESDRGEAWAEVLSELEDKQASCDELENEPELELP